MPVILTLSPRSRKDLQLISKRIRKAGDGRNIRKKMTRQLRKALQPTVQKVKAEAKQLPSRGVGQNKLRQQIARATSLQVKTAGRNPVVGVRVARSRMNEPQRNLPKLTNQGVWRHPVFGGDVWVNQRSKKDWFDDTVRKDGPRIHREIGKVLDEIEGEIR